MSDTATPQTACELCGDATGQTIEEHIDQLLALFDTIAVNAPADSAQKHHALKAVAHVHVLRDLHAKIDAAK